MALGEFQAVGERGVAGGQLEDHPVEHLDGHRAGRDDLGQAIQRRGDRREREDDQPLSGGERDDLQLGRVHDGQRPLRADDQPRQVELPGLVAPADGADRQARDELVEVVAADPPEDLREPGRDRLAMPRHRVADRPVDRADEVVPGADGVQLVVGQRAKSRGGAVGEHHVDGADVIDRLAVPQRPRAGRVVADHPADRGAVAGGDVRPEHQSQRLEVRVEPVEHDPRLDPDGHPVAIDDADPVQVLRKIEHDGRPDGLPRQARGGPARQHRDPLLGRDPDGRHHVGGGARHDHAQRLDLVQACVGGVEPAGAPIEINLGAGLSAQSFMQAVRGGCGGHGRILGQDGRRHHIQMAEDGRQTKRVDSGSAPGSCSEIGVEKGVDPGWHAHVFVGMSRWAKGLRTCPRRRGHATRDDPPPLPEHEPCPQR